MTMFRLEIDQLEEASRDFPVMEKLQNLELQLHLELINIHTTYVAVAYLPNYDVCSYLVMGVSPLERGKYGKWGSNLHLLSRYM